MRDHYDFENRFDVEAWKKDVLTMTKEEILSFGRHAIAAESILPEDKIAEMFVEAKALGREITQSLLDDTFDAKKDELVKRFEQFSPIERAIAWNSYKGYRPSHDMASVERVKKFQKAFVKLMLDAFGPLPTSDDRPPLKYIV